MSFSASVDLGTIGKGITGQTVSISGCTGASCGSGCTSLVTSQAVSGFPKTITGIPDNVVSLFVKVDGGSCSGTTQCISITGLPGAVATPTPTATSTPTATPTPTSSGTPTPTATTTPTPTATSTPTATATSTPTPTPSIQITNCVRLVKSRPAFDPECSTTRIQRVTVTLYDSTGANEVDATYDITVTLGGTGDDGEPTTWDLVISAGESFAIDDIIVGEQTSGECTVRDGTAVTRLVGGIESISNPSIVECTPITPSPGTVFNRFYYGQGLSTSIAHCGTNYTINASFFSSATTISGLMNQTIYTTDTGSSVFNGLGLWYPVALGTGTNTGFGDYWVIKINSNGAVEDIAYIGDCDEAVPL